jgi:hypothetical protein
MMFAGGIFVVSKLRNFVFLSCLGLIACEPVSEEIPDFWSSVRSMQCGQRWRKSEAIVPRPRRFPSVTRTRFGVTIFGGFGDTATLADGWRWDGHTWNPLPTEGMPGPRMAHVAVATSHGIFVWGGYRDGESLDDGAYFDETTSTWHTVSRDGAPSPRSNVGACWNGREIVLFGGQDSDGNPLGDGFAYDPATNTWRTLPTENAPRARWGAILVCHNNETLVWSGKGDEIALGAEDTMAFDHDTQRWIARDATHAPRASSGPLSLETTDGLWAMSSDTAAVYNATEHTWNPRAHIRIFENSLGVAVASMPGAVVLWGGRDDTGLHNRGSCYDIHRDVWNSLPTHGAPDARTDAVLFWDGARMMLLWGSDDRGLRDEMWVLE